MKGKILDFNLQEANGVISGDDGKRYKFTTAQWKATDVHPAKGTAVDFDVDEDGNAVDIYVDETVNAQQTQQADIPADGKNKIAAALLAFFLGGLGIHKFYLGCTTAGIIMLLTFILGFILLGIPTLVISVIAFIEFIIYLTKSDADFYETYVKNKKCWF